MKKKLCVLIMVICLVSLTACGSSNTQDEATDNTAQPQGNSAVSDESTYDQITHNGSSDDTEMEPEIVDYGDGLLVVPGTYKVGEYIADTDYLITCIETDYSMQVVVFESVDNFNNYQNTERITNGEELAAIEQNALYDYYLTAGEAGYLRLDTGYVLLIDYGNGVLNEFDVQDSDEADIYSGTYFIGQDIEESSYLLTCDTADYSMTVIVFESIDTYRNYHQTSRFTTGEELAAVEQNALCDYYLEEGESGYLNLKNGYVLLLDDGNGRLNNIDIQGANGSASWYSGDNIGLHCGVYFVGDDLESAQYSLTCIGSYMDVVVFENMDSYMNYHQSSRFTGGEETDAIEQNAISSEYLYEGASLAIYLHEGNILMISNGVGDLEKLGN